MYLYLLVHGILKFNNFEIIRWSVHLSRYPATQISKRKLNSRVHNYGIIELWQNDWVISLRWSSTICYFLSSQTSFPWATFWAGLSCFIYCIIFYFSSPSSQSTHYLKNQRNIWTSLSILRYLVVHCCTKSELLFSFNCLRSDFPKIIPRTVIIPP